MAKHFTVILALLILVTSVCSGCSTQKVDYPNETAFEAALNNGDDVTGKTVTFKVKDIAPNSAFGYNLQAGEHLNFCSTQNPNIKKGDTITVKVTNVSSVLGSFIISYERIN